jgi:hypothetical protein
VFDDLYEYMNSLTSLRNLMIKKENNICHSRKKHIEKNEKIVSTIYPGHGPVVRNNALEKIDEYIAHRMKREEEIYDVLNKKKNIMLEKVENDPHFIDFSQKRKKETICMIDGGRIATCPCCHRDIDYEGDYSQMDKRFDYNYLSSWEIMTTVYGPLPFIIRISAQLNVSHHLNKLKKEGKIEFCYPDLWRINRSF